VPAGPLSDHDGPGFPEAHAVAGEPGPAAPGQRPGRRTGALVAAGAAATLLLSVAGGYAGARLEDGVQAGVGGPGPTLADADDPPAGGASTLPSEGSVRDVAAVVLPSVVNIQVTTDAGSGSGSGFVIREDGLLLTNNHVIEGAADGGGTVTVVFADGSEAEAEVVGRTTPYDLAVLRVDRSGLVPLQFADSSAVAVGDEVVAVGAPLGLQGTVTTGIVSALNRPVAAGEQAQSYINAIQTDAAINPGNSGGPLVDLQGRVVGITSAIAQAPGGLGALGGAGSIGLGFAIPSQQAVATSQELIDTGSATYPVIGVSLDDRYRGPGVKVVEGETPAGPGVVPGGPADRAGIEPGDLITEFEGRPVTANDELIVAIRAQRPGDAVTLTVRRDGVDREVELVLDEAEGD